MTATDAPLRRVLVAVALMTLVLLSVLTPPAMADAPFTAIPAANQTLNGDITSASNALLTCPASASTCAAARNGSGSLLNNNDFNMAYVDVDGDPATFNSSTADLAIPTGGEVVWAGLFWGADTQAGDNPTGTAAPNAAIRNQVSLKVANSAAYTTLTADTVYDSTGLPSIYHAYKDVTAAVALAGAGTYSVGNVQAGTGGNSEAGWSLVVIYRDLSQPARKFDVFNGLALVVPGGPQTIALNGFRTPRTGTTVTDLGLIAYEGDLGLAGDRATLTSGANSTPLANATNPAGNLFNGSISRDGANLAARNRNDVNNFGYDADLIALPPNALPNDATSATIRLTTTEDTYLPAVVFFATDISQPRFSPTKTVTNVSQPGNDPLASPADVLEYTISGTNTGDAASMGTVLTDAIPAGTTYLPGSLRITAGANAGAKTDAAGDDQANVSGGNVVFRLGTGADGTTGGSIAVGESYTVKFRVTVNANAAPRSTITNSGTMGFGIAGTPGINLQAETNPVTTTVAIVDLTIDKAHTGVLVQGTTRNYTFSVSNVGTLPSSGSITVTDTFPTGLTPGSATGSGWTCTTTGQTVSCSTPAVAAAGGGSLPTITVPAAVAVNAPTGANALDNTATVSGGRDGNPANNSDTDPGTAGTDGDVAIRKSVSNATPAVGTTVIYTLLVTNNGPSTATGVAVADTLPAGLTFVSVSTTQGTCNATSPVACTIGTLTNGQSATVSIVAAVGASAAGNTLVNTGTVSSTSTDTNAANNSDSASVSVGGQADLAIDKSQSPGTLVAGGAISYDLLVTNNGPNTATGVQVSDPLPTAVGSPTVTVVRGGGSCSIAGGTVSCALSDLPNGATALVRVSGTLSQASAGTNVSNTATVRGTLPDPVPANNTDSVSGPVTSDADVQIVKTITAGTPATAGNTLTYTLTARNNGPTTAANVTVTDTLPASLTLVSVTPGAPTCTSSGQTITCALGTVASGGSTAITVVARIGGAVTGTIANTATIGTTTPDSNPANNTSTVSTPVGVNGDVRIVKTVSTPAPTVGTTIIYTLAVTNDGPSVATGVQVADTLPSGLAFVSASSTQGTCNAASPVACTLGTLTSGQTVTVSIVATVTAAAAETTKVNTGTVTSTSPDANPANNSDSATITVGAQADLSIVKSQLPAVFVAGGPVSYDLAVTNKGPSTATGVRVRDVLPSAVLSPTATVVSGAGTCTIAGGTLTCDLADLPNGAGAVVRVAGTLSQASAGTTVTNTGTVSGTRPDPTPADNSSTVSRPVGRSADVAIVKTTTAGTPAIAGTNLTYRLAVSNDGVSDAASTVVSDTLPAGLTLVSVTPGTPSCTNAGQTITCDLGTLAAGARTNITVVARIAASFVGTLTNTGTVATSTPETTTANNSSTVSTPATASGDVQITETGSPAAINPGEDVTFTLVVKNNGPSTATGVRVVDDLPQDLTLVSVTPQRGTCTGTTTLTCDIGTLAVDETVTITVVAKAKQAAAGTTQANPARVSSASPDANPDNNTTTASVSVPQTTDLALTKVGTPRAIAVGETATYTLTTLNKGPEAATGVALVDTLPAGLAYVSSTPAGACTANGQVVTCTLDTIASGATAQVMITARALVEGSGTTVTNAATVRSSQFESDPDDNSAQANIDIKPAVDLGVTKVVSGPKQAGQNATYTMVVSNAGPNTATGVTLDDPLPNGLTLVSATPSQGFCGPSGGSVACSLGTIQVGASAQITLVAAVGASAAGEISNVATATGTETELNPADNTATATATFAPVPPVAAPPAAADVSVLKEVVTGAARVGAPLTYRMTVKNNGPDAAQGVRLFDTLGSTVTFVSAVPTQGTCTGGPAVVCSLGTLAAGATATVRITVTPKAGGTLANTASVTSDTSDPVAANNVSTVRTPVAVPQAVLTIAKDVDRATVRPGQLLTYTIVVRNRSSVTATNVTVCDRIPSGLVFVSSSGATLRKGEACWKLAALVGGKSRSFTLRLRVAVGRAPGPLVNVARVNGRNATATVRNAATVKVRAARASRSRPAGVTG